MQLPQGLLEPHILLQVLHQWHTDHPREHPIPFPGPLASRTELVLWLKDVREKCEKRGIHSYHHANAVISWLPRSTDVPDATEEAVKFRVQITARMHQVRKWPGWLHEGRYWKWVEFREEFLKMCQSEKRKRNCAAFLMLLIKIASAGAGILSFMMMVVVFLALLPIMGPVLGAVGFTAGGVAAGSIAAGLQSTFYGGATGGLFSLLQSAGARAAAPAMGRIIAAVGPLYRGVSYIQTAATVLKKLLSIGDASQNNTGELQAAVKALGDIGDVPLFTTWAKPSP